MYVKEIKGTLSCHPDAKNIYEITYKIPDGIQSVILIKKITFSLFFFFFNLETSHSSGFALHWNYTCCIFTK